MISSKEIFLLFDAKKPDDDWSFAECRPSDTGKWTHDYHRYPAKFIPQLVEKLFDEFVSDDEAHINDLFYGCGTAIVTAISRGLKASGTDINGIAYLITKVKSTPIEPGYLDKRIQDFLSGAKRLESFRTRLFHSGPKPLIPERHAERINYWFTRETKIELGKLLRIIQAENDEQIRDFLLVGFSHILKNCSTWLEGSVKPQRNLEKKPLKPYEAIRRHLRRMQEGNKVFYRVVPSRVRENIDDYLNIRVGDARHQSVPRESIDLIVTSSPYVTSYEYADLHQLSTIWLDLAEDLNEYRKKFIGTSYAKSENRNPRSNIALEIFNKMLDKSQKIANEIRAFFSDMDEVFSESLRILKPGGRCCYVIGNTRLRGVDVFNAEVFAESLQLSGLTLDKIIKREVPLKILPQKRDEKTGRFTNNNEAILDAYPIEYILVGLKE